MGCTKEENWTEPKQGLVLLNEFLLIKLSTEIIN
jgi:hypothetical protein